MSDFSFSSRNWGKGIQLSLSPLEIREMVFKFLFLFSKLGKVNSDFSFSSRNGRNCFQISLSLLDLTFLTLVNHWIREGSKKKIFTFSRPWLLRGGRAGDMSRPTKLFYGLKRGKKGPKMVLKSTKKVN